MSKRVILSAFILGAISLIVFSALTWGNLGNYLNLNRKSGLVSFYLVIAMDLLLLVLGLTYRKKDRWLSFTLAAVLLLGFSISYIYSLGFFLIPFGLVLLVISLRKLAYFRRA